MRTVLAVLAAFLVAAPAADAAAPVDWMPRFEAAAIDYWGHGSPPPCGTPTFAWTTLDADGEIARGCRVLFDVDRWHRMPDPGMRCVLTFHEIAHLYGIGHQPGDLVMDARPRVEAWRSFAPCARLVRGPVLAPPRALFSRRQPR